MSDNEIIESIFERNKQEIVFVKAENNLKCDSYYYVYENFANSNKLNLLIKAISTFLNKKVVSSFENQMLRIDVYYNKGQKLDFMTYLSTVPHNQNNILLGVDLNGYPIYDRIENIKSLLIGGASGSGKTNLLHQIILSYLLLNNNVYLAMIDMKGNELTRYNPLSNCNFMVRPTAYTPEEALKTLVIFKNEIMDRFKRMQRLGLRNSNEPPFLLVIDEYAQLFQDNNQKKIINQLVSSCAALGRAANCYLFLATQHPTNDNINSTIRANMQSRLGLKCMTGQQSHNILENPKATTLLNPGDFILHLDGKQETLGGACYVPDEVIDKVVNCNK